VLEWQKGYDRNPWLCPLEGEVRTAEARKSERERQRVKGRQEREIMSVREKPKPQQHIFGSFPETRLCHNFPSRMPTMLFVLNSRDMCN
jgi:hypothetical protein